MRRQESRVETGGLFYITSVSRSNLIGQLNLRFCERNRRFGAGKIYR